MKIAVGVKIRNEIDITELFLSHLDALFDVVYLMDHKSKDGTSDVLKEAVSKRKKWEYFYLDFNGHFHKQVSNAIMDRAFKSGADALFLLDADEFIDVRNRKDLENIVHRLMDSGMPGTLRWKNCIPEEFNSKKFTSNRMVWLPSEQSIYTKVIIPKCIYDNYQGVTISQGNHFLNYKGKKIDSIDVGTLLHIPVRSKDQAEKKILIKCIAYMAIKKRNPINGFHNFKMLEKVASNTLDYDTLRGFAFLYEKEEAILSISEKELLKRRYRKTSLKEMRIPISNSLKFSKLNLSDSSNHVIADSLLNWKEEDPENNDFIIEGSKMIMRAKRKSLLNIKPIKKVYSFAVKTLKRNRLIAQILDVIMGRTSLKSLFKLKKKWKYEYLKNPCKTETSLLDNKNITDRISVDVVVCVHNALDDVKKCFNSLIPTLESNHKVIIVDDQSDLETRTYLKKFVKDNLSKVRIVRTKEQSFYTKSANIGLRESKADFIIFLNSDTVVSNNWINKMIGSAFADDSIGIVGPLSNAANLQSIPSISRTGDNTAINKLPDGMSVEDINNLCENWSKEYDYPIVPFVHGFCLGVKREVINRIGSFDEDNFAKGFGEETDYCLRACKSGLNCVIAIDTYVFHAKSKSYAVNTRKELMRSTYQVLARKHTMEKLEVVHDALKDNPILKKMRKKSSIILG